MIRPPFVGAAAAPFGAAGHANAELTPKPAGGAEPEDEPVAFWLWRNSVMVPIMCFGDNLFVGRWMRASLWVGVREPALSASWLRFRNNRQALT